VQAIGNDPRYTPTTTFGSFPFPDGLTPNIAADDYADDPRAINIGNAGKRLDELRNNWLNPPDLIDLVPEVVTGYPDRILPKNEQAAAELKKRTLTNLYNQRPQWLADAHRDLDAAVAAATAGRPTFRRTTRWQSFSNSIWLVQRLQTPLKKKMMTRAHERRLRMGEPARGAPPGQEVGLRKGAEPMV
jgi:hypothetical protein